MSNLDYFHFVAVYSTVESMDGTMSIGDITSWTSRVAALGPGPLIALGRHGDDLKALFPDQDNIAKWELASAT